ncbi:hypothetical protein Cch01nite_39190 [Cellulomonas chitinilytica]|uniref:Extradiol ring-cleavage dioxygenase class III enzyme subunit B domain-containing protein n=1 Tax=Cellulomonas chitinilytica TaxID=398759 RepID=A0A919U0S0_9CELL|nr:hypothetical protein [Cellulomonas chitinilytica]GIG23195.1 hypothetical protein Cch01nite_39190 [Cellulomonas chitinilytica]
MLVAAALVPDTALLVPGAAGTADPVADLRDAALEVVTAAVSGASRVVVVAPGREVREATGTVRGSLGAAGIPDGMLGWPVPERSLDRPDGSGHSGGAGEPGALGVPAAVALHLLARAGWDGPLGVLEVADADDLAARGRALVARDRVALVVVGSGSGRHGPDAPLADDPRAPAFDDRVLAALADAGPAARAQLAATDAVLAAELAVTGAAPWKVLVGAVGDVDVRATVPAAGTPAGAHHAVVLWSVTGAAADGG